MLDKVKYYINKLDLKEHPEGGYFKENYRCGEFIHPPQLPARYTESRCFSTSIYFLLEGNQKSNLHRLKSDELWHFYDGSPVRIYIIKPTGELLENILGNNLEREESYQITIEKNTWFAAEVMEKGSFSLIGCTVAPGFDFKDFELGERDFLLKKYPHLGTLVKKFTRDKKGGL